MTAGNLDTTNLLLGIHFWQSFAMLLAWTLAALAVVLGDMAIGGNRAAL